MELRDAEVMFAQSTAEKEKEVAMEEEHGKEKKEATEYRETTVGSSEGQVHRDIPGEKPENEEIAIADAAFESRLNDLVQRMKEVIVVKREKKEGSREPSSIKEEHGNQPEHNEEEPRTYSMQKSTSMAENMNEDETRSAQYSNKLSKTRSTGKKQYPPVPLQNC